MKPPTYRLRNPDTRGCSPRTGKDEYFPDQTPEPTLKMPEPVNGGEDDWRSLARLYAPPIIAFVLLVILLVLVCAAVDAGQPPH